MLQLSFVNFRKDSFLIVEGQAETENFYIIQSGKVRTYRDIEVSSQDQKILGPGDVVGVISCMSGHSRTEYAVALTDVAFTALFIKVVYPLKSNFEVDLMAPPLALAVP